MAENLQAKRFTVSGMVQGVGYRFFAERVAERLGIAGYVKNMRDGSVEVYAIGSGEQLQALRAELERGPHMASVSGVEELEAEFLAQHPVDFSIEHDW
ncbi:MAG: acylphosphatase [Terriglobales bacterium]